MSRTIPNPHGRDIGPKLLAKLLRQANISREEWGGSDPGLIGGAIYHVMNKTGSRENFPEGVVEICSCMPNLAVRKFLNLFRYSNGSPAASNEKG
jgi:hypothetical protein